MRVDCDTYGELPLNFNQTTENRGDTANGILYLQENLIDKQSRIHVEAVK